MTEWLGRQTLLIGESGTKRLQKSSVALLGVGGVGGAALEGLVRAGIGRILLIDHDEVELSNLNRQIIATLPALGRKKIEVAKERVLSINPHLKIEISDTFYLPETRDVLFDFCPDLVIDAIDTVTAKLDLAQECFRRSIPLLASMGTGNRLDPTQLRMGDISQTAGCGCALARVMRRELKKRGILHYRVLYSTEAPIKSVLAASENGRHSPGSISFVPPVAGFILAGEAVRLLSATSA